MPSSKGPEKDKIRLFYLDPNEDIRDLYTMKLEADYKAQVVEFSQESNLCEELNKNSAVDVIIISDYGVTVETPENSSFMTQYKNKWVDIPLAIMAEEANLVSAAFVKWTEGVNKLAILKRSANTEEFDFAFQNLMGQKGIDSSDNNLEKIQYAGIKIKNFVKFNVIPCDAYIRLSDIKFIKLINQGDMYGGEVIAKYQRKKVQKLYVKTIDYPILAKAAIQSLIGLYDKKRIKGHESDTHLESLETIHQAVKSMGISEEVAILTKKTIESSVALVKRNKDIGELLNRMKKNGDYLYEHSMMVSYISTAIARHTEWGSDATAFKLSLASMMHDMTLEDNTMAQIQTLDDPQLKKYSPEQVERYKNHPMEAAKLIADNKEFPPDVDFIVAQHHERPDGSGFPRGLSKLRISPLSCVFILAHEFVTRIEQLGGDYTEKNRSQVFSALSEHMYTVGNFKRPYEGLKKVFESNLLPSKK